VQLREATSDVIRVSETIAPGFIVDRFDKTGDPLIDTMTALLLNRTAFAHVVVGRGVGAAYGSRVHTEFAKTVRLQEIPGVEVEQSFDNEGDMPNMEQTAASERTSFSETPIRRSLESGILRPVRRDLSPKESGSFAIN
jgi:hypothetical protein